MDQKPRHGVAPLDSLHRISQGQSEGVDRPGLLSGGQSAFRLIQVVGRILCGPWLWARGCS